MTIEAAPKRVRFAWRRLLGFAAIALLAAFLCVPAAFAQDDPFGWFTHLFQPAPEPSHVMKQKRPRSRVQTRAPVRPRQEARPRYHERQTDTAGAGAAAKPQTPAVAPTFFVAVIGDSLAQTLAQGLTDAFVDRPEIGLLREAKADSGLVRDDFYDWTKAAQDMLASGKRIDFAVMMIGSNDRQTLRDGKGGAFEPLSPQWKEAYSSRIEAIAAMFRDKKIPLVWVGLPVFKNERPSADATAFNDLYREYAGKAGATYIDVWQAFANDAGEYSAIGPDMNGQIVKLRTSDGVHFTEAGALKLAHFVEPEIRRTFEETKAKESPEGPAISAPAEASLPPADATPANEATPAIPSVRPAPPPKPIAGPVLPLTGPVRAPGGELAARANPARPILEQDQPSEPKPGRADDFSWPRP
jgi:hypothetical protein